MINSSNHKPLDTTECHDNSIMYMQLLNFHNTSVATNHAYKLPLHKTQLSSKAMT